MEGQAKLGNISVSSIPLPAQRSCLHTYTAHHQAAQIQATQWIHKNKEDYIICKYIQSDDNWKSRRKLNNRYNLARDILIWKVFILSMQRDA